MSVEPKPKAPSIDPQLLNQLLAGKKTAGDIEDLLKDLRKAFIEHALQGELTDLLGYPKHQVAGRNSGNSRNGHSRKRIKTDESEIEVDIPRDRQGQFEPKLIAKHQTRSRRV
jgi:putative transposase